MPKICKTCGLRIGFSVFEDKRFPCENCAEAFRNENARQADHERQAQLATTDHDRALQLAGAEHQRQLELAEAQRHIEEERTKPKNFAKTEEEQTKRDNYAKQEEEKTKRAIHAKDVEKELKRIEKESEFKLKSLELDIEQERTKQKKLEVQAASSADAKMSKAIRIIEALEKLDESSRQMVRSIISQPDIRGDVQPGSNEKHIPHSQQVSLNSMPELNGSLTARSPMSSFNNRPHTTAFGPSEKKGAQTNTPRQQPIWTAVHATLARTY